MTKDIEIAFPVIAAVSQQHVFFNYSLDIVPGKRYSLAIRGEFPDKFNLETEEKQKWQTV
jgi:hypothetical protein